MHYYSILSAASHIAANHELTIKKHLGVDRAFDGPPRYYLLDAENCPAIAQQNLSLEQLLTWFAEYPDANTADAAQMLLEELADQRHSARDFYFSSIQPAHITSHHGHL